MGEFPGRLVVRTPRFHCRGPGFYIWSGELRSRKLRGQKEKKKVLEEECSERGNSECKGPEARALFVYMRSSEETSMAGAGSGG